MFEAQAAGWLADHNLTNSVQRVGAATREYNCHSFAWNISEGGSNVWVNAFLNSDYNSFNPYNFNNTPPLPKNISRYWDDGSYIQVGNESMANKVWYGSCWVWTGYGWSDNCDHSAVRLSNGLYKSKWGAWPLYIHAYNDCPYTWLNRKYYIKRPRISGPSTICDQAIYTIDNLSEEATVQWSIPFSGAPYPRLNPNVPEVNQATITNPNNYPINMTLTATIYMGSDSITTLTKLVAVQGNSTTQYGSYYQQGCIVNNITLRTLSGSINGNYFYLNQGCLAEITLYEMTNKSVSFNSGYPPSYWFYDAANSKLLVRPAVGSSGVPTTFKITGGCTDKIVQFFTYSLNEGRLSASFTLSPNPAATSVTVEIEEEAPMDNSANFLSPDMKKSDNYQVQLWNSFGLVRQVTADMTSYQLDLTGVPPGFYYVHVIKDGLTYRRQLVVK